jgi:hypothetical protein
MSGPGADEVLAAEPRLAPEESAEVVVGTRAVATAVGVPAYVIGALRTVAGNFALPSSTISRCASSRRSRPMTCMSMICTAFAS